MWIYVMRDFYSWWYTWWVDGQTETRIPYWRVGVPTSSCKNRLENEGSRLREDKGWMKIWSKFIHFMKAPANVIMDLLTRFQTIWTIRLSLKFARSDFKTDERKCSHGVIRKFMEVLWSSWVENTVSIFSRGVIGPYKIYLWQLGVHAKPFMVIESHPLLYSILSILFSQS